MSLYDFTQNFIALSSLRYFTFQVIAIFVLALYGIVFMMALRGEKVSLFDMLLAYPLSLCVYALSGYLLLSVAIPFNRATMIAAMLIVLCVVLFIFRNNLIELKNSNVITAKRLLITAGFILVVAVICTSGILPVSVTNDSMYFFSEYPRALIYYGKLTSILDNFLTDASQGIAIIGTIPFFFGFDEMFGIQSFLNINFILIFVHACYETAKDKLLDYKVTVKVLTILSFVLLITAMPYFVMARWLMANMFYMEFMFIVVYLAGYISKKGNITASDMTVLSILLTGLSIMRIEGAVYAGFIVLCIMMLDYTNKDIAIYLVCPVLLLQSAYLYRIFGILTLHTSIQFMTKEKAILLIAFLIAILIYALFVRNRLFNRLLKYYHWLLITGLVIVNILALFRDRGDYVTNLIAIKNNLTRNSGWGLFVSMIIGIIILIPKKSIKINFFDITVISYILLSVVTVWARGDALYESFGDSGNRVLIQAVPIIVYSVFIKIAEGIEFWKKEDLS